MTIYTLDPGVTSSGLTLNPGDQVFVAGVISATTNNSGLDLITSGGQAFDTAVNSGGVEVVTLLGSATSTTVNSGGEQDVYGTALSTIILGGLQVVESGGSATGTTVLSAGRRRSALAARRPAPS
jgi:autotransporter passenger strand-loop-strand repeat protein